MVFVGMDPPVGSPSDLVTGFGLPHSGSFLIFGSVARDNDNFGAQGQQKTTKKVFRTGDKAVLRAKLLSGILLVIEGCKVMPPTVLFVSLCWFIVNSCD